MPPLWSTNLQTPLVTTASLIVNQITVIKVNSLISYGNLVWYFLPSVVLAQTNPPQSIQEGLEQFRNETNLGTDFELIPTVARIINILLGFLGVLAVILVLWAGFKWMTAAGDEQQINDAKKIMSGGVIGLMIILVAYAITAFVINQLTEATGYNGA